MAFTTKDHDNDKQSYNCALSYKGAWWYNDCYSSHLNGLYRNGANDVEGVVWRGWKPDFYNLKGSEMKMRPTVF